MLFTSAFIAEVVGTIAGFGSSTIFLPVALLFLDFRTALVLVAFFHFFGNIGRLSFFRRGLDKSLLLKFGLPSIFLTIGGALLVSKIPQESLKGILGLFLLLYASYSFWKEDFAFKATLLNTVVGGGLSGFLAGLIGTGGALRGAFLTAFGLPKEKYIATAASIALAVDITRIPLYVQQGFLEAKFIWYLPVLLILALSGSFTGKQIVRRLPQNKFRKIVLIAIFLIGIKFVYDWVL